MAGPDVPKAGDLGLVPMTRIAPTVARWFDVQLSPEADRPLELASAGQRALAIQAAAPAPILGPCGSVVRPGAGSDHRPHSR